MDIQQATGVVAAKLNTTIVLHGEKPITKRNISLSKISIDQVIGRIMRLYGVKNHAEIFSTEKNQLRRIDVHLYSTTVDVQNLQTQSLMDYSDGKKPLTIDQTASLIAQSIQIEEELNESSRPLTTEQTEHLQMQSWEQEAETNSANTPLTPEQIEKLRDRSQTIHLEEQDEALPLSIEQLQRARQNSALIEAENERARQPLTKDQVLLLQERGKD